MKGSGWRKAGIYRWRIIESVVPPAIRDSGVADSPRKTKKKKKKNEKGS